MSGGGQLPVNLRLYKRESFAMAAISGTLELIRATGLVKVAYYANSLPGQRDVANALICAPDAGRLVITQEMLRLCIKRELSAFYFSSDRAIDVHLMLHDTYVLLQQRLIDQE